MKGNELKDFDKSWRGSLLEDVYRRLNEFDLPHFPPIEASSETTVLYKLPIDGTTLPEPYLKTPKWDALHVRLPNSAESLCSIQNEEEHTGKEKFRWNLIKDALSRTIKSTNELQDAILIYNPEFRNKWNFRALHAILNDEFSAEEKDNFFNDLLPRIISLALQLPKLIQAPIPLLRQNETHSLSLTQQQVSCLLANAFLCTFPFRSSLKRRQPKESEYHTYPEINFNRLFQTSSPERREKIKCLLNYFQRVCPYSNSYANVPTGVVTFFRQSLSPADFPDWSTCRAVIGETILHIDAAGVIEDGIGLLQVDFANKYVGGGVLGFGCVQEEIRFVTNPELIVAKLFTEFLLPNEALFMIGCEQYNNYSGYSSSFKWTSDHIDETPRDTSKRRKVQIVAINALSFRQPKDQYQENLMLRELNKAYAGFLYQLKKPAPGIATGNWGCGAFRGDPRLKFLLQLMVACVTERTLAYFTFFDAKLRDEIYEIYDFLKREKVNVGDLWCVLKDFLTHMSDSQNLYDYIKKEFERRKNLT